MVSSTARRLSAIGAVSAAVLLHIAFQFSVVVAKPGWSLDKFRDYGALDQLSYMGIVANAANGKFTSLEPFTETGSNFYPQFYYDAVGAFAGIAHLTPPTAWAIAGLACQVALVVVLAIACIVVSGKTWTALLAALPFVLGTLSNVTSHSWYTPIGTQALLWGPFAAFFPLNAEAAGLCAAGIALLVFLLVYLRGHRPGRLAYVLIASGIVGLIANMQTYSFLTAVFLISFTVAGFAIISAQNIWLAILSVALIPVLFFAGPVLGSSTGPLGALAFGLLPAVPGMILAIVRSRGVILLAGGVAALFAAPTVIRTLVGLHDKDPFLVYRVVSSHDLGVPILTGTVAALALLVPLALVFIAGLKARNVLWISYPPGVGAAWAILSMNDRWGANQEPYRLWIDSFILIAVTLLPIAIGVVSHFLASRVEDGTPGHSPRTRKVVIGSLIAVLAIGAVSSLDWVRFTFETSRSLNLFSYQGEREDAMKSAVASTGGGLIMTDPCVDPQALKIVSDAPVVFINLGMAWPTEYQAALDLGNARAKGDLDIRAARVAEIKWVMTDSACGADWDSRYGESALTDPSPFDYRDGSITIWKFDSVGADSDK